LREKWQLLGLLKLNQAMTVSIFTSLLFQLQPLKFLGGCAGGARGLCQEGMQNRFGEFD